MFSVLQSLLTGYKKVLLKGFGAYTTQFKDVLVEVNLANYSIISMACSMICWHIQFLFLWFVIFLDPQKYVLTSAN
jgi:hypothetical protein